MDAADHVELFARTCLCREGGLHEREEVHDVFGEQVAFICPKCLDRVMPVWNMVDPRPEWPRATYFYVDYVEGFRD